MDEKIKLLISQLGEIRIKKDYDISGELASGLEGKVTAFYLATSQKELIKVVQLCREILLPFLIVGSGSKLAGLKSEFGGLLIKNRSDNIRLFGIKGKVSQKGLGVEEASLEVDSGVSLKRLSQFALSQKLIGLDNLIELPGTVGGNFFLPNLRQMIDQTKVLGEDNQVVVKSSTTVSKDDIILSVVLHLKAKA